MIGVHGVSRFIKSGGFRKLSGFARSDLSAQAGVLIPSVPKSYIGQD